MYNEEVYVRPGEIKELVLSDKVFKSFNDFELTKEELERAHDELGETVEKKNKCLKELKEKLSKNGKVNYCTDDSYLLRFLRVRKYGVERAYQNVKLFYDVKKKNPSCFAIPSDVKSIQSLNFATCLPYCDEEGRIIFWTNIEKGNVNYRTDDSYLLRFLRARKYSVEKAYQNMKLFYDLKKKNPSMFIIPSDVKSLHNLNFSTYLPYSDEEGRIIFWMCADRWDPEDHTCEEMVQCMVSVCDVAITNPRSQINGFISVWDSRGLTMRHFAELLKNNRVWTILSILQNGYPYRISKLIILNTGRITQLLFNLARPFLSKKVSQRIFLIGSDVKELHQHVNPAILPKTLGGSLDEEECILTQHITENLPYLRYERSFI